MDGIFPAGVKAADGWLVTGSKFGVYESHDWIGLLEEFLREAYAGNVPIVGICFGHQILAQALGGKAEKFKRRWSVGVEAYSPGRPLRGGTLNSLAIDTASGWAADQIVEFFKRAR